MSPGFRATGMILGGLPAGEGEAREALRAYVRAGIRAFALPGALLSSPTAAVSLAVQARILTEEAGLGRPLIAMGGGESARFELPYAPLAPTPLCIAASGSAGAARRAGRILGAQAAACRVDLVLAPRLDLATDPKDGSGALDLFGIDPRKAALLGGEYLRGIAEGGSASCVGRFPGMGSTCRADTREGIPLLDFPEDRLSRCEMRPFARAVAAGAAAVLVGRAYVPAFEPERIPALRSARVIEGRLRTELGFRGIVVGDDSSDEADPGRAAVLSALAGCDLGFFSDPAAAIAAAEALERAAASGELPAPRFEFSRSRVDDFLKRRARSAEAESREPTGAALQKAAKDREEGFCLLSGSLTLNAAASGLYKGVLVVLFSPPVRSPQAREAKAAAEALRVGLPGAHVALLRTDPETGDADALTRTLERAGGYSEAVILTYDAHLRPAQESLARFVEESVPRFVVVAMRNPYDAAFFPKAAGLGAALGFSASAAKTVVGHLSGRARAKGRCPVPVLGIEV